MTTTPTTPLNRTSHQLSLSAERMTLPLSGRSLTKGLIKGTLALVLGLGAMQGARAATDVWTNNTSTNFLSNSVGKWSNSINPLSGDSWVFANTTGATLTNNFLSGFNVAGITFNFGTAASTINGNSINLSGAIINNSIVTQTLNTAFVLTGSQTITTATNASSKLVLGGVISDGGSAYGLTFNGINGTTTLTNAATYSGATLVQGSTLVLTNGGSLASSALTITNVGFLSGFTITNAVSTNVLYVSSTNGLAVGQNITGNGINTGTTITAITDANHITISANTTSTGSNNTAAPAQVFTSAGTVQAYGSTLTNVTVEGNGTSYANAAGNGGSAGTANFTASNTTINGTLTIKGPTSGMSYVIANATNNSIGKNYGYASLNTGVTLTNLLMNGRLDILGSGSMSLSNISGTSNGNAYYPGAGGGSGAFSIGSTYGTANSAAGFGNVLNFVGGSVFGAISQSNSTYATFTQSGTGTVSFATITGTGVSNSLYTFSGGNWFFSQIGQANSSQQAGGTNVLVNGASLTVGTNNIGQNGGVWVVGNGTMTFQTNAQASSSLKTQGQNFGMVVSNTGTLNMLGSYVTGGTSVITNTTFFMTNNGGLVNISGAVTVGSAGATNDINNFTTTNGGVTRLASNLTVGTTGSTTTVNAADTVTLGGGTLSVAGTLGAGTNAGEVNSFNWSGGTLSAGTITATNTTWTGAQSAITNGGLYNTNGNLLVGNSTNGYAGKTTITGNYSASGSATTTFNVFGTTAASTWTGATNNYSFLTNTGTASLGGVIVANFGSFTPATNNSFTLVGAAGGLSSTATLSGANAYNGYAFWNDGLNYSKLSTNATQLSLVYGGLNQWQNGTGTWDASTNNWTAGVNPNATNLAAYFGANGGGGTITVSGNKTNTSLTLSNNSTGYTLNGSGTLSLGNAGSANLTSFGTNAVNPNIALNGQLNITGTGALTLGGNISGNYGLVDSNTGSVTLAGSNSYVGSTLIANGATLLASSTNSFGSSANWSNVTVNGSTLALSFGSGAWDQTSLSSLLGNVNLTNNSTLSLDSSLGGGTLTTSLSGGYSLGVQGTGTITLTGNNSGLSNGVTLIGGTLVAQSANALGNTLTLKGGKLDLGGNTATFSTVAFNGNNFTVTNGSFTVTSGYTASNATVSQNLGGAASFTANGGTVVLNGANTYSGATLVTAGTLYSTFDAGTAYTVTNAGSTFVAGASIDKNWTDSGVASVLLNSGTTLAVDATGTNFQLNASLTNGTGATLGTYGTGTLTLGGANNSAISALSVTSGTLAIGSASLNVTNLTLSGGVLDLGGQSLAFNNTPTLVAGTLKNGAVSISSSNAFSTNLTLTNNAALNFSTNVSFAANTTSTISGSGTVTDTGYLYQGNSSALTLNGGSYYFGRVYEGTTNTQTGNTFTITNGANVSVSTNNGLNGVYGFSVNSANSQVLIGGSNGSSNSILNLNGGRLNLNVGDSILVTQGGVVTNAQLYLYGNSTATLTNGGSFYGVTNYIVGRTGTNSSLNIGSVNGSTSVLNGGSSASQLNIGTSNSISNSVVVNQGGLITNVGYALIGGTVAADITSSYNQLIVTNGGVVRFSGTSTNILGYSTNDNSNSIVVTGAGSFLSQGGSLYVGYTNYGTNTGNNVQVLNGGVLSNSGTAIVLDNTNSYMTISGGTVYAKSIVLNNSTTLLTLSNNGSTNGAIIALANGNLISGSGTVSLAGNGTISAGSYSATNNTVITGPGTLTVNGGGATGTLTMAVSNSYTGGTIISSGTLAVTNLNVLGSGSLTDNGTLALSLSGTSQNVNQNIAGTGGLSVLGAGTLSLSGSNTYLGTTVITNATVNYQTSGSLASNSALTVRSGGNIYLTNTGTTFNLSAFTNAVQTNSGSITLNAGSSMTISNGATLSYSDVGYNFNGNRIMVNGGTLTVDNGGTISSTNLVGSRIGIGAGGLISVLNGGYLDMGVYSADIGVSAGTNILTNAVGGIVKMAGLYMGYPQGSGVQSGLNELLNSGLITNTGTMNIGDDKSNSLATNIVQNYGTGTITGGGNVTIGALASASNLFNNAGYVSAGALTVGNNSNSAINVLTNTGTFIASGTSLMGAGGSTNNTIYNNGVLTVNANLTVGNSAGVAAINTLNNASSGSLTVSSLIVGNGGANGNNTVTNDGTLTANQIQLGGSSAGAGTNILTSSGNIIYTGAGSTAYNIGNGSNATGLNELILTGGIMSNSTASTAPWINIGNSTAATGTNIFSLSGGARYVGYASSNSASWRQIYVGVQGSQTDILTNNGGTISNINQLVVGAGASNNASIAYLGNGTITANASPSFGFSVGGYGTNYLSQGATNTFTIGAGGVFNGNNSSIGAYSVNNNNTVDLESGSGRGATIGTLTLGAVTAFYTNGYISSYSTNVVGGVTNITTNYSTNTFTASGNTNKLIIGSDSTLSTTQILAGAGSAAAGDSNSIIISGGTLLAGSGANTNFLASGVADVSISGTGTINDGGQAITIGASISDGSSAGQLIKAGAGTLTLSGVNTYASGTRIDGGGLNITSANSLGAGDLVMNGGTKFAYTGIGAATLNNNIRLLSDNGTIANSSGSDLTLAGNLTNSGSGLTLAGGTFNVNGTVTGDYALSNATANLSGLNTYSAPSSILAGSSLKLGGNDNLTTGSALNFGSTTDFSSQTNTLNLAGYNQTVASVANVGNSSSQIIDSVGGSTFTLTGNSLFGGSFGGLTSSSAQRNLNLTVASGANVNLTGNNTYTGNTTIQQGATLDLGNGGSLSGASKVILNSGTLLLGGNGRTDSIDQSTALTLSGGKISMGGNNATSRTASQTFASLTLTADSTIDFANLSGDSSLTFANIVMNGNTLNIFDWSGDQSSTQAGSFTHLYDLNSLSASDLSHINFYAGNSISSEFLGIGGFSGNNEIVPVPEPGVIVAAIMLLGCLIFGNRWMLIAMINRRRVA